MNERTSSTEGRKGVAVVGKIGRNFWVCEVDEEGSAEGAWIWMEAGMDCRRGVGPLRQPSVRRKRRELTRPESVAHLLLQELLNNLLELLDQFRVELVIREPGTARQLD